LKDYAISHNVYLDIFILHVCPDNAIQRANQYMWAKYIVAKAQSVKDLSRYGFLLRTALRFLRCFPRLFLVKHALKKVYKHRNKKTSLYCNYLGKAKRKRGTYKREWFETTKRVPFENVTLRVPIGVEEFLSERFGDYMKIPDMKQIRREQHASVWDTEKDYKEYMQHEPTMPAKYVL
jgi:lipopolysaccharide cholinephosphotransferase